MSWVYIEREHFVRMCEKIVVSATVRDAIKLWAPTVSRFELSRQIVVKAHEIHLHPPECLADEGIERLVYPPRDVGGYHAFKDALPVRISGLLNARQSPHNEIEHHGECQKQNIGQDEL